MATADDAALRAETQGPLINSLAIIFAAISTTCVALRLYTRKFMLHAIGPDDVIIACAQVLAIAVSVITGLEVLWGLGQHTQFVDPGDAIKQLKSLYAITTVYNLSQILTKISFLIQYRRLFPSQTIQSICFYLLVFITAWGITQEFIVGFSCTPLTSFMPSMVGKCIYTLPVWYLTSCMNIVTDFIVFGVPVVPVLKLQMRLRQKLLLLCLFGLGFFTCIISLVRLSTLHKGVNTTDPMWDNSGAAYWSVVELNCGIICACLPTLRPLIQKFIPSYWSSHYSTGRADTTSSGTLGLSNFRKKNRQDAEDGMEEGIIVQKEVDVEVELQSTSELRSETTDYRNSVEEAGGSTSYVSSRMKERN